MYFYLELVLIVYRNCIMNKIYMLLALMSIDSFYGMEEDLQKKKLLLALTELVCVKNNSRIVSINNKPIESAEKTTTILQEYFRFNKCNKNPDLKVVVNDKTSVFYRFDYQKQEYKLIITDDFQWDQKTCFKKNKIKSIQFMNNNHLPNANFVIYYFLGKKKSSQWLKLTILESMNCYYYKTIYSSYNPKKVEQLNKIFDFLLIRKVEEKETTRNDLLQKKLKNGVQFAALYEKLDENKKNILLKIDPDYWMMYLNCNTN